MYLSLCCYCESKTETTGFGQIEHRLPKKHFPEKTYDWKNLHWSCFRCNHTKGDFFDKADPVLDSAEDDISEHLAYNGYKRVFSTRRGENTISATDLNRRDLTLERKKLLNSISAILDLVLSGEISRKKAKVVFLYLKEFQEGQYGSFVEHILHSQGVDFFSF